MDQATAAALAALGSHGIAGDSSAVASAATMGEFVDMDAMLNEDLADIPDLPDVIVPKEGAYLFDVEKVDLNAQVGKDKKRAIMITYNIDQCLEIKGTLTGDDAKPGNKMIDMYFMSTPKGAEFTKQLLKKLLAPVSARTNAPNLLETLKNFQGFKIVAQVKHTTDKEDKTKVFAKVVKIVLPE